MGFVLNADDSICWTWATDLSVDNPDQCILRWSEMFWLKYEFRTFVMLVQFYLCCPKSAERKNRSNTESWVCVRKFFNSQLDLRDPHLILSVCKPGSSSEPLSVSRSPGTRSGLGRRFSWLQTWRLGRSVEVFGFGKDARTWKVVGVNPCTSWGRMTQQVSE